MSEKLSLKNFQKKFPGWHSGNLEQGITDSKEHSGLVEVSFDHPVMAMLVLAQEQNGIGEDDQLENGSYLALKSDVEKCLDALRKKMKSVEPSIPGTFDIMPTIMFIAFGCATVLVAPVFSRAWNDFVECLFCGMSI